MGTTLDKMDIQQSVFKNEFQPKKGAFAESPFWILGGYKVAKNHRVKTWDSKITVKLRSSQRTQLAEIDPTRTLTELVREAIDLYLDRQHAQNENSLAV